MIGSKQLYIIAALLGINLSAVLSKTLVENKSSSAAKFLKHRVSQKAIHATEHEIASTLTDQTLSETTQLDINVNATTRATIIETKRRNNNSSSSNSNSLAGNIGSIRGAHIHDIGVNQVSEQDGSIMEQEHFSAHETINAGRQGKNTVHTHANYNKSVLLVEKDANTTITTHANSVQVFEYEDQVIITRSDPTNHSALKEAGPIGKNSKQNGNPFADRLSLDAANIGKPQQSIDVPTLPNAEIIGSLNISSNEINTQDKNVSLVDNGPMRTKDNVTGGGNAIKSGANTAHAVETLVTGEKSDPQDYETQIVKLTHKSKGENTTTGDDEATGHYEFEEAVVIHRPGSKRASAFSFGTP